MDRMRRTRIAALALALLLCGCGRTAPAESAAPPQTAPAEESAAESAPAPEATEEPVLFEHPYAPDTEEAELPPEEIGDLCAQSALLPKLREIRLTAPPEDAGQLALLRGAFPEARLVYRVELFGETLDSETEELDLSGRDPAELDAAAETLALLPCLKRVVLPESAELPLVDRILALPSAPAADWPFELYGQSFSTADESMNLNGVHVPDGGEALREMLPRMRLCRAVEMEYSNLSNEELAALREDFPEAGVVWRVFFDAYSTRTDVEKILASLPDYYLDGRECEPLRYCSRVRYLDLGHNVIDDISFVRGMPELEVAILAINYWTDASPLAGCEKLEYLEMFTTGCSDISPLAGLKNLRHLNITNLKDLSDVTPLYGLTGLERLWIGCIHSIPPEQLEELARRLPDTEINTTTLYPTAEGWRVNPRYDLLKEQMGYGWIASYATH